MFTATLVLRYGVQEVEILYSIHYLSLPIINPIRNIGPEFARSPITGSIHPKKGTYISHYQHASVNHLTTQKRTREAPSQPQSRRKPNILHLTLTPRRSRRKRVVRDITRSDL